MNLSIFKRDSVQILIINLFLCISIFCMSVGIVTSSWFKSLNGLLAIFIYVFFVGYSLFAVGWIVVALILFIEIMNEEDN